MTYTMDMMEVRMGFKSNIELVLSYTQCVCDIIYVGYDVINIVCAMTYKQLYEVIKSGCDVRNRAYGVLNAVAVISYIHRV